MTAMNRARAFTLIELLVVLMILAVTTTIALRSAAQVEERTRFDATQRILEEAARALVGTEGEAPVPGYLGDLGKPAGIVDLWQKPDGVPMSHVVTVTMDPEVHVMRGWRGPYLHLPPFPAGTTPNLIDGYGRDVVLDLKEHRWVLTSKPKPDEPPIPDPIELVLYDEELGINRIFASLTVDVEVPENLAGSEIEVRVYGAKNVTLEEGPVVGTTHTFATPDEKPLFVGPVVVRAYALKTAPTAPIADEEGFEAAEPPVAFSAASDVVAMNLHRGANVLRVDLPAFEPLSP